MGKVSKDEAVPLYNAEPAPSPPPPPSGHALIPEHADTPESCQL